MSKFDNLTISSAINGLTKKDFTSVELTEHFIKKIDKRSQLLMFHFYEWSLFIYKNKDIFTTTKNNRKFDDDEVVNRAMRLL